MDEHNNITGENLQQESNSGEDKGVLRKFLRTTFDMIRDFYTGQILLYPSVKRALNPTALTAILLMSVIYIAMGYQCDRKRRELASKQEMANDYRLKAIELETKLMRTYRESNIIKMLDERDIQLSATNQPPIEL